MRQSLLPGPSRAGVSRAPGLGGGGSAAAGTGPRASSSILRRPRRRAPKRPRLRAGGRAARDCLSSTSRGPLASRKQAGATASQRSWRILWEVTSGRRSLPQSDSGWHRRSLVSHFPIWTRWPPSARTYSCSSPLLKGISRSRRAFPSRPHPRPPRAQNLTPQGSLDMRVELPMSEFRADQHIGSVSRSELLRRVKGGVRVSRA